jgi:hypothetical protein
LLFFTNELGFNEKSGVHTFFGGLQATVGLVISLLLLVDISLTLLMLLQFYSISLEPMLVVLLVPPLASVLPSAAGLNALFSHGPPRSAGLARVYALWNLTSFTNLVSTHTPALCAISLFDRIGYPTVPFPLH